MSSVPILRINVNVPKDTMLKFDTNLDANVHIGTKDPFTSSESGSESENFVWCLSVVAWSSSLSLAVNGP